MQQISCGLSLDCLAMPLFSRTSLEGFCTTYKQQNKTSKCSTYFSLCCIGYSHGKGYIDSFTFLLTHPLVVWQYPEKNVPDWYQACASYVRDRSFRLFCARVCHHSTIAQKCLLHVDIKGHINYLGAWIKKK